MSQPLPPQDGISNRVVLQDETVAWVDASGDYVQRLGFGDADDTFRILCRLANAFRPIARRVFPEDSLVIILYDLAIAICDIAQNVFGGLQRGAPLTAFDDSRETLKTRLSAIVDRL